MLKTFNNINNMIKIFRFQVLLTTKYFIKGIIFSMFISLFNKSDSNKTLVDRKKKTVR